MEHFTSPRTLSSGVSSSTSLNNIQSLGNGHGSTTSRSVIHNELIHIISNNVSVTSEQIRNYTKLAKCSSDVVLKYYTSVLLTNSNQVFMARELLHECIRIKPEFVQPVLQLVNIYIMERDHINTVKWLKFNYGRPTLHPETGRTELYIPHQMQMMIMLTHECMSTTDYDTTKHVIRLARRMLKKYNSELEPRWLFTMALAMGELYNKYSQPEECYHEYHNILQLAWNNKWIPSVESIHTREPKQSSTVVSSHTFDLYNTLVNTLGAYSLVMYFVPNPDIALFTSWMETIHPYRSTRRLMDVQPNSLIKLAYLTPDLNKNAVSLFCTALLKRYDTTKFDVTVFYTNARKDEFTHIFMSYPVKWVDATNCTTNQLIYMLSRMDIIVDLLGRTNSHLDICSHVTTPIIINYLGYPGTSGTPVYTHRLVDTITDPESSGIHAPVGQHSQVITEQMLYMKQHPFVCFTMHPNIVIPSIRDTFTDTIRIGILQRHIKINQEFIQHLVDVRTMLLKHSSIKVSFYFKDDRDVMYDYSSYTRLKPYTRFPFRSSLSEYLNDYNELDLCIDTFPYSGTTTTCSSLLMGVPVFTCSKFKLHVSRVSTSILSRMSTTAYVSKTLESQCQRIYDWVCEWMKLSSDQRLGMKMDIRRRFEAMMNPDLFMKEYEEILCNVVSSTDT